LGGAGKTIDITLEPVTAIITNVDAVDGPGTAQSVFQYHYTGTGNTPALLDNRTLVKIGGAGQAIDILGTIFQPLSLKNDTSIRAYNVAYDATKNLISRANGDVNIPDIGDGVGPTPNYLEEVIVGDSDVVTAIKSTSGFAPVVRFGAYGTTDDYEIYHTGNIDPTLYQLDLGFGTASQILATNITADGTEWTDLVWGSIGGTLANQTDLQAALDAKEDNLPAVGSNGTVLQSDGAAYSWAFPIGSSTQVFTVADGLAGTDAVNFSQLATKEDSLGNPALDGYVITSTAAGVRTWVSPSSNIPDTDLSYDAPTMIVSSSTGLDATLTLVDVSNNGLMSVADKSKLDNITGTGSIVDLADIGTNTQGISDINTYVGIDDTSGLSLRIKTNEDDIDAIELKTDLITITTPISLDLVTVTQAVDLDAIETNSDASKVITDWITVTQAVDLDAIELATTTNAQSIVDIELKTDFITVTQNVDLDTIETDVFNSKTKTDFITVTGAANLDNMQTNIADNAIAATPQGGTTVARPVDPTLYTIYWDTDINTAAGGSITCTDNTNGANVWKDANGVVV